MVHGYSLARRTPKKEKTKWKEGEPPDLLRRRKDVFFPV
jgi:hypothetical protein